MFDIKIHPQEQSCNAKFNGEVVMTKGFNKTFEPFSSLLALSTLEVIKKDKVNSNEGANYLQVVKFDNKKFWGIDAGSYIAFLLPEEY